jgi:hypothetical protein
MLDRMPSLRLVTEAPSPATLEQRLAACRAGYEEAAAVAGAYRALLRNLAMEAVESGMRSVEVADRAGVSRMTINDWRRAAKRPVD